MYGYGWSGGRVGRRQEGQVGRGTRTFSFEFLGERGTGTGAHGASWSPSPAGHWVGVAVPFSDPIHGLLVYRRTSVAGCFQFS